MRLYRLVPLVIILCGSQPGFAQSWVTHVSLEDRFSVNLPGDPEVEDITYPSEYGAIFPARVYTHEDGPNRYSVTVVNYADAGRVSTVRGSIAHAAWNFRKRGGEVTYDAFAQVDRIGGHQLQITNASHLRCDPSARATPLHFGGNRASRFAAAGAISGITCYPRRGGK